MPKYDHYFGLHVADLNRLPSHDVRTLKQTERNIVRVPRFSKIVARHVRQRLAKPRRNLLTDGFKTSLYITTTGNSKIILPLSVYVRLVNFCNRLLLSYRHPNRLPSKPALDQFVKQTEPAGRTLCHHFFHDLGHILAIIVSLLQTTSLLNAACQIDGTFSFHPYWQSANSGPCVVVTDPVYGLLNFLTCLNMQAHLIEAQVQYGSGNGPQNIGQHLQRLCKQCPQTFPRYREVARRQLTFTLHRWQRLTPR